MQRIPCRERDDWQATAEACGFDFHTIDGVRYWDERDAQAAAASGDAGAAMPGLFGWQFPRGISA